MRIFSNKKHYKTNGKLIGIVAKSINTNTAQFDFDNPKKIKMKERKK